MKESLTTGVSPSRPEKRASVQLCWFNVYQEMSNAEQPVGPANLLKSKTTNRNWSSCRLR